MKKILYSPGYGAGWSTWMDGIPAKFACEYKPIIEAIEKGENLLGENKNDWDIDESKLHESVKQFVEDCKNLYKEKPYLGGIDDLKIYELDKDDQYQITEYDGSESVELRSKQNWN